MINKITKICTHQSPKEREWEKNGIEKEIKVEKKDYVI
jgi:hypothetical protein